MDGKTMRFAVYGFFLKRKFSFNNFTFTPVETELKFWNVVKKSQDSQYYNLMCYIETSELDAKKIYF